MEISEIINNLKEKFGDKLDVAKVKEMLQNEKGKMPSMSEIIAKLKSGGLLGDLDGDGKVESTMDELKGKIGGMFHK